MVDFKGPKGNEKEHVDLRRALEALQKKATANMESLTGVPHNNGSHRLFQMPGGDAGLNLIRNKVTESILSLERPFQTARNGKDSPAKTPPTPPSNPLQGSKKKTKAKKDDEVRARKKTVGQIEEENRENAKHGSMLAIYIQQAAGRPVLNRAQEREIGRRLEQARSRLEEAVFSNQYAFDQLIEWCEKKRANGKSIRFISDVNSKNSRGDSRRSLMKELPTIIQELKTHALEARWWFFLGTGMDPSEAFLELQKTIKTTWAPCSSKTEKHPDEACLMQKLSEVINQPGLAQVQGVFQRGESGGRGFVRDYWGSLQTKRTEAAKKLFRLVIRKKHLKTIMGQMRTDGKQMAEAFIHRDEPEARSRLYAQEEKYGLLYRHPDLEKTQEEPSSNRTMRQVLQEMEQAEAGYTAVVHEMAENNIRLVIAAAKKLKDQKLPLLDLIQYGNQGLMRAVHKWDPGRGLKFSTFAVPWIRQQIFRESDNVARFIKLPVYVEEELAQLKSAVGEFLVLHGRKMTIPELAEKLEISKERVMWLLQKKQEVTSLNLSVGVEDGSEKGKLLENPKAAQPDNVAESTEEQAKARSTVEELMTVLTPEEQQVLNYRYGIGVSGPNSLEETAIHFGYLHSRSFKGCKCVRLRAELIGLPDPERQFVSQYLDEELKEVFGVEGHSYGKPDVISIRVIESMALMKLKKNSSGPVEFP